MPSREARSSSYLDFDSKEDSGSSSAAHNNSSRNSNSNSSSSGQQHSSSSRRLTHRAGAKSMYTGFNYDCDELDDDDLTTASYREMASKGAAPESAAISRYVLYSYLILAAVYNVL
jgi:hypothetical protein